VKRKVIIAIVLAAIGFAVWRTMVRPTVTRAQTPTVAAILEHYVTALGGRAAIQSATTRVSKGTIEVLGLQNVGVAESYAKAPNKYLTTVQLPGVGVYKHGFDGTSGWISDPDPKKGLSDMSGEDLSSMRRAAEFYQPIKIAEVYKNLKLVGQQNVAGRPAYEIDADPGDGTIRRMYFDVESGLMVRNDEELDLPGGRASTLSYFEDYRDVQGVKHPFTIRQVQGETEATIHLVQVLVNQPVDDAMFLKPKQ
jgi:zinc protease